MIRGRVRVRARWTRATAAHLAARGRVKRRHNQHRRHAALLDAFYVGYVHGHLHTGKELSQLLDNRPQQLKVHFTRRILGAGNERNGNLVRNQLAQVRRQIQDLHHHGRHVGIGVLERLVPVDGKTKPDWKRGEA